jgi:hypothetical protein
LNFAGEDRSGWPQISQQIEPESGHASLPRNGKARDFAVPNLGADAAIAQDMFHHPVVGIAWQCSTIGLFNMAPEHIRSDNGAEFPAKTVRSWLERIDVKTL